MEESEKVDKKIKEQPSKATLGFKVEPFEKSSQISTVKDPGHKTVAHGKLTRSQSRLAREQQELEKVDETIGKVSPNF